MHLLVMLVYWFSESLWNVLRLDHLIHYLINDVVTMLWIYLCLTCVTYEVDLDRGMDPNIFLTFSNIVKVCVYMSVWGVRETRKKSQDGSHNLLYDDIMCVVFKPEGGVD